MDVILSTRLSILLLKNVISEYAIPLLDVADICTNYVTNHFARFEELILNKVWNQALTAQDIAVLFHSKEEFVVDYLSMFSSTFIYPEDHIITLADFEYMFETRMKTHEKLLDLLMAPDDADRCERFCCRGHLGRGRCVCGDPLIRPVPRPIAQNSLQ